MVKAFKKMNNKEIKAFVKENNKFDITDDEIKMIKENIDKDSLEKIINYSEYKQKEKDEEQRELKIEEETEKNRKKKDLENEKKIESTRVKETIVDKQKNVDFILSTPTRLLNFLFNKESLFYLMIAIILGLAMYFKSQNFEN